MHSELIEIERKRRLPDDGAVVRSRLQRLGYLDKGTVTEVDIYYSRPDVDYLETVECLRIRRRDGFAEITYKPASDTATHSADDVIAKVETNVRLAGPKEAVSAVRLLEAVGMRRLATVTKLRTRYLHPGFAGSVISLDVVDGVGTFVETEVNSPSAEEATALLEGIERQLAITEYPTVALPYRDLVRHIGEPQPI
ncbi:class IV adenylate cyclase [Streptomyces sp. NPDC052396]|uniref:class IV adenylate cyclase n=1 Tax=Streptomyces sp. NPDC052396 TaxID=3365689 RepID=UPI0037D0790B